MARQRVAYRKSCWSAAATEARYTASCLELSLAKACCENQVGWTGSTGLFDCKGRWARCRSGSSSTSPCPRPDTISMQPRIHASTHAIRSPIPPEIHPPLQRLSIQTHGKLAETYREVSFRSFVIESLISNFKLLFPLKSTPLTRSFVQLTPSQSHKSVPSTPHPCSASHAP